MNLFQDDIDFILHLNEKVLYDATSNIHSSRALERLLRADLIGHVKVGGNFNTNLYMLTKAGQHTAGMLFYKENKSKEKLYD